MVCGRRPFFCRRKTCARIGRRDHGNTGEGDPGTARAAATAFLYAATSGTGCGDCVGELSGKIEQGVWVWERKFLQEQGIEGSLKIGNLQSYPLAAFFDLPPSPPIRCGSRALNRAFSFRHSQAISRGSSALALLFPLLPAICRAKPSALRHYCRREAEWASRQSVRTGNSHA